MRSKENARWAAIALAAFVSAGCGFDSARAKQPSHLVAPVISQPEAHRAQIDAIRREAAARQPADTPADPEPAGTARVSSSDGRTTRFGATISSDPPTPLGRTQPWETTDFD